MAAMTLDHIIYDVGVLRRPDLTKQWTTRMMESPAIPPHEDVIGTIKRVYGFIMTQMTAKAGIKKHGRAAKEALMKEFAQFETLNVYKALDSRLLTAEQ